MKGLFKKILTITICFGLLFPLFQIHAFAAVSGFYEYTVTGSTATITRYTGNDFIVNIPNNLDGYTVTAIGGNVYNPVFNMSLRSVTIPDSVTSIGAYAFYGCSGLTSITIPNSVTSIGNHAFERCVSLTSITIPDSVTSIGEDAFSFCYGLINITIPGSVASIGDYAFYSCTGLTSITISDGVTSIGNNAFYICPGLTSITIPDSVTSIGNGAFGGCSGLTSITIPGSVTSISGFAFAGCSGLTNLTIQDGVTSIGGYAFQGCSGLTSITIPDSVTSIGEDAFSFCSGLTNIIIPNSVTSIGVDAFRSCIGLTSILIPDSVTSISSYTFEGCSGLTSITIPDSVTSIGDRAFLDCTNLISITIPGSVTSISDYTFQNCAGLTSITIPDGLASIGDYAFQNCASLTSITIPDGLASIGDYAFQNCTGLTSIIFPDGVTSIGESAFTGCSDLTSVLFNGNAPTIFGGSVFFGTKPDFVIYYLEGKAGWTTPTWYVYKTIPITPPTTPGTPALLSRTPNQITFNWAASLSNTGSITGYKIYRDGVYIATVTGLTYTDTGLTPGTNYSYTIKAVDSYGMESNPSQAIVFSTVSLEKEITGYTPLTAVTLTNDEHIITLSELKASGKLPTTITVTDGTTPASANITNWTGTFNGTTTGTYTLTPAWTMPTGYTDNTNPISVTIAINVNTAQTAASTDKEITGYTPLTAITLTNDEHITTLSELKASGKLPTSITLTDGTTPISVNITGWTGTFDGTATGVYTLTPVWTLPLGYIDIIDPINVTAAINVNTVQTVLNTFSVTNVITGNINVSGTGTFGYKVELYMNGVLVGTTTVENNNTWLIALPNNRVIQTGDNINVKYFNANGVEQNSKTINVSTTPSQSNPVIVVSPTLPNVITITDPFVHVATFNETPVGTILGNDTNTIVEKPDKTIADAVIYAQDKNLKVGDKFEFMADVTAKDNGGKGKDITKKVRLSGVVNTKIPGKYTMHYSVKGKNGNTVYKDITINVE